ncbi:Uncharacterized protein dnm_066150 [Desulfonema magnum]|uniref:Uncharacterized protein n=1 Tax=Desulfonema magnum TaxID=45655 RepID=A0A975GR47_9BACT|nr:Uncharacterized protein dnm_066150 [Desulfonema magnum]
MFIIKFKIQTVFENSDDIRTEQQGSRIKSNTVRHDFCIHL